MTIIAGFRVIEGILLCADTLYTSGAKLHDDKIFPYGFGGDHDHMAIAFALAGSAVYGKLAIEDCVDAIDACPARDMTYQKVKAILKSAIKKTYTEYVDQRPEAERESAKFELIIGAYLPKGGGHNMFYSTGPVVLRMQEKYHCTGSGAYLGDYLMRDIALAKRKAALSAKEATLLAIQAFSATKKYDAYVGGDTQFVSIHAGGITSDIVPFNVKDSEAYINQFEECSRRMLFDLGDTGLTTPQFEAKLGVFCENMRTMRAFWGGRSVEYMDDLIARLNRGAPPDPPRPTDEPLPLPPSPGSSEGSGEP